jgi:hypothetical protein
MGWPDMAKVTATSVTGVTESFSEAPASAVFSGVASRYSLTHRDVAVQRPSFACPANGLVWFMRLRSGLILKAMKRGIDSDMISAELRVLDEVFCEWVFLQERTAPGLPSAPVRAF